MVCQRCVSIVQKELSNLDISGFAITLGQVSLQVPLRQESLDSLRQSLAAYGFEVMNDKQSRLVNEVKAIVEEMFSTDFDLTGVKFSRYISNKLYKDYNLISSSFSSCQGITLEKYILNRRIEKVKELLMYSNQSINNIAFDLGYSSVAHLSKQFKAITGLNLSHFRQLRTEKQTTAKFAS